MKYFLITYGCQMNTADSEEMAQPLQERGFVATAKLSDADIVLMNTCTVREQAEHRADSNIGRLRVWKDKDPNRILIIAGCAASRWGESIKKKYSFIDLVSPATQIEQFPEAVAQVLKDRWNFTGESEGTFGDVGAAGGPPENANSIQLESMRTHSIDNLPEPQGAQPAAPTFLFGTDITAYVTIMRGCNYTCSYCIVPQVRGREVYRPMPDILREIRAKVTEGYREVMLLGQTVNSYHWKGDVGGAAPTVPMDFSDLLRAVNQIPGIERIRFMSPHPRHMKNTVIDAMRDCKKVARHLHLPLQSGSSRILSEMKRLYTREEYVSLVKQLRATIPEILITTDVIVGFPGETEEDFAMTLSLMSEVRFEGLFAFKYSPRPGTTSAELKDDVTDLMKEERLQTVLALNEQIKEIRLAVG